MKDVIEFLNTIAEKLGYTAGQAWPYMVQYTWAVGVAWLVTGICVVICGLAITYYAARCMRLAEASGMRCDESGTLCFGVVLVIIGVAFATYNLPDILAPEGSTIFKVIAGVRHTACGR